LPDPRFAFRVTASVGVAQIARAGERGGRGSLFVRRGTDVAVIPRDKWRLSAAYFESATLGKRLSNDFRRLD